MNRSAASPWVVATAVVSVAILALAWFLAVSPQLEEASSAKEQTESAREQNDLLEIQIAALQADFAKLGEFTATLDGLRAEVPAVLDQAAFNREIADVATGTGAFVVEVTSATALPVGSSLAATATGGTTTAPAGLYAVPMTVTVLGNPTATLGYVAALQTGTSRLFLVSGISLTGQKEAGATGGRPATAAGDAEIVISGYVYVLTEGAVPPPAAEVPQVVTATS